MKGDRMVLAWLPGVLVLMAAIWCWTHLRRESEVLAAKQIEFQAAAGQKAPAPAKSKTGPAEVDAQRRESTQAAAATLLQEIRAEEAALSQLKRREADLAAQLPPADSDELITSFGRIEDMGSDAGSAVRSLLLGIASSPTDAVDDTAILQLLKVKGRLPEIQRFEEDPDEIARFQSSALRQALALPSATEAAMQPLIREAFAAMAAQDLTATRRPAEHTAAWIEKRSLALQQLMLRLRPHLPDSDSAGTRQALTFILNLAAGLEEQVQQEGGKGTVTMGVTWPMPPW